MRRNRSGERPQARRIAKGAYRAMVWPHRSSSTANSRFRIKSVRRVQGSPCVLGKTRKAVCTKKSPRELIVLWHGHKGQVCQLKDKSESKSQDGCELTCGLGDDHCRAYKSYRMLLRYIDASTSKKGGM